MNELTIARRYAQALYAEAESEGRVEQVDEDIDLIRATLDGSRDLVLFFESPVISREKKEAVVKALFGERVQETTINFLRLLIQKQRENLFPVVVRAYRELRDQQLGVVEAQARVALPLNENEKQHLERALENLAGARVRLRVQHDPSLIGGLVVRLGDTVYDGSVRHQLANLRERLEHGSFAGNGMGA